MVLYSGGASWCYSWCYGCSLACSCCTSGVTGAVGEVGAVAVLDALKV